MGAAGRKALVDYKVQWIFRRKKTPLEGLWMDVLRVLEWKGQQDFLKMSRGREY